MTYRTFAAGFLASLIFGLAVAPVSANERVLLVPHRAVYDLVLDTGKPARGIEAATSRIVFDFSGDACDGYQLNFRQVTRIDASEGERRVIDARTSTSEAGDASRFRFINENRIEGAPASKVDGEARRQGSGYKVVVKPPNGGEMDLGGDVLFPTALLKATIVAARAGQTTLNAPVFDGAEDGRQVHDSFTVIGRPISATAPEEPLRKAGMEKMRRWPVTTSYFKRGAAEQTPSYVVSLELLENGVARAVRMDYGDFALKGELHLARPPEGV